MKDGRSPGEDGFRIEFYKSMHDTVSTKPFRVCEEALAS
jgi:hypothetical protein